MFLRLTACVVLPLLLLAAVAHATAVSGTLVGDTTWTAAQSPYELTDSVTIPAGVTLTLEDGVRVVAQGLCRLYVNGTLQADGTTAHGIVFQALDSASRGAWEGLYVSAGGRCELHATTVRNATTALTAVGATLQLTDCSLTLAQDDGLLAWGATTLSATGTAFDNNGRRGLYLEGYEVTGTVSGCWFRQNGEYPVWLKATEAEVLQAGNRYARNGVQRIAVSCSLATDLTDSDRWTAQGVDFDLTAGGGEHVLTVAAGGVLTLGPGVRVRGSALDVSGQLLALGKASAPCRLLSPRTSPAPGDWEGLTLRAGSRAYLYWLEVAHAQTGLTADGAVVRLWDSTVRDCQYDGVRLTGASVANLRRTTFSGNGRYGLKLEGRTLTGLVKNCQFNTNASHPVWAMAAAVALLRSPNTYTGNGVQRIAVSCGEDPDLPTGSYLWAAQPLPLDLTASDLGRVLNIGHGTALVLSPGLTLLGEGVDVRGRLEARGTSSRPVCFGPPTTNPAPGDWTGLSFTGATGYLTGALVEYAQVGVALTNCSLPLRECVVRYSQYDGLRLRGATCQPVVTTSQFLSNGRHGVLVENSAWPNLGNLGSTPTTDDGGNRLANNAGYDLYNNTANLLMAQSNWWTSADSAAIAARIYDQADDSQCGRVRYDPFLGATPNSPPVLSWAQAAGYENDGLNPETGPPASTWFRFQVRYSDTEGTPPTAVAVHVAAAGSEITGSPFGLDRGTGTDYASGVLYYKGMNLPAGRAYTYWFTASDGQADALGAPTSARAGPVVNTAPQLGWVGQDGWTADGVDPDAGSAGVEFRFRCRYQDADGDAPAVLWCHLSRGGAPVTGSPFALTPVAGTNYVAGLTYELRRALTATGTYTYRFEGGDGLETATGAATVEQNGPLVTAAGGVLALSGLSARPVRGGLVQVCFRLTTPAAVTVEVLNLAGRCVARPAGQAALPAGPQALYWNGRALAGTAAPAGAYLLRVTLAAPGGARCGSLVPFTYWP